MENKLVIDTNVMISVLIGKRLKRFKDKLSDSSIRLIITEQLINEIHLVCSRPKLIKYFNKNDVDEFIDLISIIGKSYAIQNIPEVCRDPKDNFLLALCEIGGADYLVTGDKDLLDLKKYKNTRIVSAYEFEKML